MGRRGFVKGWGLAAALGLALGTGALPGLAAPAEASRLPAGGPSAPGVTPPAVAGTPPLLPPVTVPDALAPVTGAVPAVTLPSLAAETSPATAPRAPSRVPSGPATAPAVAPPARPTASTVPDARGPVADGAVAEGSRPGTDGPMSLRLRRAAAETAGPFTFPVVLAGAIVAFLLLQPRLDRDDPTLAHAGVGRDDDLLGFS